MGLQISSYDEESIEKNKDLLQNMDSILKMQLNALATAYKGLTGYSLPLIENLSKKYWNYKGFYNLEARGNYSYFLISFNS